MSSENAGIKINLTSMIIFDIESEDRKVVRIEVAGYETLAKLKQVYVAEYKKNTNTEINLENISLTFFSRIFLDNERVVDIKEIIGNERLKVTRKKVSSQVLGNFQANKNDKSQNTNSSQVLPSKVELTIHNELRKRDYNYSLDNLGLSVGELKENLSTVGDVTRLPSSDFDLWIDNEKLEDARSLKDLGQTTIVLKTKFSSNLAPVPTSAEIISQPVSSDRDEIFLPILNAEGKHINLKVKKTDTFGVVKQEYAKKMELSPDEISSITLLSPTGIEIKDQCQVSELDIPPCAVLRAAKKLQFDVISMDASVTEASISTSIEMFDHEKVSDLKRRYLINGFGTISNINPEDIVLKYQDEILEDFTELKSIKQSGNTPPAISAIIPSFKITVYSDGVPPIEVEVTANDTIGDLKLKYIRKFESINRSPQTIAPDSLNVYFEEKLQVDAAFVSKNMTQVQISGTVPTFPTQSKEMLVVGLRDYNYINSPTEQQIQYTDILPPAIVRHVNGSAQHVYFYGEIDINGVPKRQLIFLSNNYIAWQKQHGLDSSHFVECPREMTISSDPNTSYAYIYNFVRPFFYECASGMPVRMFFRTRNSNALLFTQEELQLISASTVPLLIPYQTINPYTNLSFMTYCVYTKNWQGQYEFKVIPVEHCLNVFQQGNYIKLTQTPCVEPNIQVSPSEHLQLYNTLLQYHSFALTSNPAMTTTNTTTTMTTTTNTVSTPFYSTVPNASSFWVGSNLTTGNVSNTIQNPNPTTHTTTSMGYGNSSAGGS